MTARLITGSIAIALAISATIAHAGSLTTSAALPLAVAGVGQAPTGDAAALQKQAQADDLLRRARQAMAENDHSAAESLIAQAERLGVNYGPFHFGDTPQKAARDLERRRASTPARPSQASSPYPVAGAVDPFAAQQAATVGGPHRLPPIDQGAAIPKLNPTPTDAPFGKIQPSAPPAMDLRAPATLPHPQPSMAGQPGINSNEILLAARRALALGDTRRAGMLVEQAKALGAQRGPADDTPESVEAALRKYNDLMAVAADRKSTESYRREYARLLLEQSEGLLRRGDLDESERLANLAARQQVMYGPLESKPEHLLQRIAATRHPGQAAPLAAPAAVDPAAVLANKQTCGQLIRFARDAMNRGDYAQAQNLALQARSLQVPDNAYLPGEDRPAMLLADLQRVQPQGVMPAAAQVVMPAGGAAGMDQRASRAVYDPAMDPTRNMPAGFTAPQPAAPQAAPTLAPAQPQPVAAAATNVGMALFEQGEAALRNRDTESALRFFREAVGYRDQLDPVSAQRLQDHLQLLSMTAAQQRPAPTMVEDAASKQQLLARQVQADVVQQESNARTLLTTDPKKAVVMMEQTRQKVEQASLDPQAREQLLRRCDRALTEMRQYVEEHRPRIELEEKNKRTRDDIARTERSKLEVQEKLALLVDDFNRLMDEQRYEEAEVLAKRATELDAENPVVRQLNLQAKFVRAFMNNASLKDAKEQGFLAAMRSVDISSVPQDDQTPYVMPNAKDWKDLTARRGKLLAAQQRRRSERDIEIEQKLKTPVSLQFEGAPLSRVVEYLGKLAEVNMHLDPQGLADEGVTTDTPVTIKLEREISLKSALNLILQPLHLNYVIKDEVLKVTSEQQRSGEVYTVTYNVADLVVPIPNFVPAADGGGLSSSLRTAMNNVGFGSGTPFGASNAPLAVVASKDGMRNSATINPTVLAQMPGTGGGGAAGGMGGLAGGNVPIGAGGPGGMGGGAQADFDSLIELIKQTVKPQSWDEVGGPGAVAPFETNLSLVISQTQDVHEEIADLLEQLRKLQDLQVTIEVRFITLNDNFFERIGVDFDFDLNDNIDRPFQIFGRQDPQRQTSYSPGPFNTDSGVPRDVADRDLRGSDSATVGLSAPGIFSADLDVPFRQGSFGLAVPQFGNFDAAAGASMGFAILSDIEAYFFIEAAQGDRRSNVLQAPKVTLFNGQQAFVSDTSQSPFVISVIPVVGDFAAAQQPVIVVLSEGTFLTVQAVVSNDRRFVRLTVVPFFSKIGDVRTFTFTGKETTTDNTSAEGNQEDPNDNTKKNNEKSTTREGTTVQLPTFSFVTVTTTVSVPDGGTVLLGGIKRLSEGRNEFGVPILNKIPYVNRLFKNVGIGRETQSLMMMVTPRIIIQEEEEDRLGVN